MEKEIKERLLKKELKIQREIYMFKLYNNYGKLLYKNIELWFVRKKIEYNNKKYKRRKRHDKIRKR